MPYQRPDSHEPAETVDRLVFLGGTSLAILAGFINVFMLSIFTVPVSHMSGAVSRLGIDIGQEKSGDLKAVLAIIAGFFAGTILSGFFLGSNKLRYSWRYVTVLALECAALTGAALLIATDERFSLVLAAFACGLQNAMASSFHGLIIRTTHVTGIVTDLGFMIGSFLNRKPIKSWKLLLLMSLLLGYFFGGLASMIGLNHWGHPTIWFAVGLNGLILISYGLVNWRKRRQPLLASAPTRNQEIHRPLA